MYIKKTLKISGCLLALTITSGYAFEVVMPDGALIQQPNDKPASKHFYIGIQQGILKNVLNSSGEISAHFADSFIKDKKILSNPNANGLGFLTEIVLGGLRDVGNNGALGVEINAGVNTGTIRTSGPSTSKPSDPTAFVLQKIKYDYGASVLLGHYLSSNHHALGYIRAGWTRALINSTPETPVGGLAGSDKSFDQWDNGLRLGVGFINQLTNHLSWRSEVGYMRYKKFSQKSPSGYFSIDPAKGDTETATWTYKPYQLAFTTGIVYNF